MVESIKNDYNYALGLNETKPNAVLVEGLQNAASYLRESEDELVVKTEECSAPKRVSLS